MTDAREQFLVNGKEVTQTEYHRQLAIDHALYGNAFVHTAVMPNGYLRFRRLDPTTVQLDTEGQVTSGDDKSC